MSRVPSSIARFCLGQATALLRYQGPIGNPSGMPGEPGTIWLFAAGLHLLLRHSSLSGIGEPFTLPAMPGESCAAGTEWAERVEAVPPSVMQGDTVKTPNHVTSITFLGVYSARPDPCVAGEPDLGAMASQMPSRIKIAIRPCNHATLPAIVSPPRHSLFSRSLPTVTN